MYCKNCGSEVHEEAVVCTKCGVLLKEINNTKSSNESENTFGLIGFILSFFIPVVGLILSIIGYKKARDGDAKYKSLALAGIIISAVSIGLYVLFIIIWFIMFFAILSSMPYYILLI